MSYHHSLFNPVVRAAARRIGRRRGDRGGRGGLIGLLLSAASLVFLLSWWIVSFTKSRAHKAHPSNAADATPSDVKLSS